MGSKSKSLKKEAGAFGKKHLVIVHARVRVPTKQLIAQMGQEAYDKLVESKHGHQILYSQQAFVITIPRPNRGRNRGIKLSGGKGRRPVRVNQIHSHIVQAETKKQPGLMKSMADRIFQRKSS